MKLLKCNFKSKKEAKNIIQQKKKKLESKSKKKKKQVKHVNIQTLKIKKIS